MPVDPRVLLSPAAVTGLTLNTRIQDRRRWLVSAIAPASDRTGGTTPGNAPELRTELITMIRATLAATLGLAAALGLTLAIAPAASGAPSNTYTVSRTVGPYNGAAKLGEPGSVPDGEAVVELPTSHILRKPLSDRPAASEPRLRDRTGVRDDLDTMMQ